MNEHDVLAERFQAHRPRLRAIAYQALGSASRARRRIQGTAPAPGTDLSRQRALADAFLAAARKGDFSALLEVLDPGVVARFNGTEAFRGAAAVAGRALPFTRVAQLTLPALVNGTPGLVIAADGRPVTLVWFTIAGGKIAAIDFTDDPRCIAEASLAMLAADRPRPLTV